jgi:hypothetical protein
VFSEIAIAVEEGNPPRFSLTESGSPPRLATVAVVDVDTEQPIWWLVPASFAAVLPFTTDEITAEEIDALADAEPIDPIEDLPPSDLRHREAIAVRDSVNDAAFPVLGTLTYGVVPPGFRQASPEAGIAALVPGRSYTLTVMGPGGHGSVAFRVEHGTGRRPTMG